MEESILLYNFKSPFMLGQLKTICARMGLKVHIVGPDSYGLPLGIVAFGGEKLIEEYQKQKADGTPFSDEMLIFAGLTGERIDEFLTSMKSMKLPKIDLKAMVTEYNATWSSFELHQALTEEHEAVMKTLRNKKKQ